MMEREFVKINEDAARIAQSLMSFSEYQMGTRTSITNIK